MSPCGRAGAPWLTPRCSPSRGRSCAPPRGRWSLVILRWGGLGLPSLTPTGVSLRGAALPMLHRRLPVLLLRPLVRWWFWPLLLPLCLWLVCVLLRSPV